MAKIRIEVWMTGGVIQDIEKPDDVEVVVYDGDVEDYSEDEVETDPFGTKWLKVVW